MTCREKLGMEHPEKINGFYTGGCAGCPHEYGYMDRPAYCWGCGNDKICARCWDREIPETESTPEPKPEKYFETLYQETMKALECCLDDGINGIDPCTICPLCEEKYCGRTLHENCYELLRQLHKDGDTNAK